MTDISQILKAVYWAGMIGYVLILTWLFIGIEQSPTKFITIGDPIPGMIEAEIALGVFLLIYSAIQVPRNMGD